MKSACIQMDMLFAQPEENFAKAKRLIREAMAGEPDVLSCRKHGAPVFSRKSVFPNWPSGTARG